MDSKKINLLLIILFILILLFFVYFFKSKDASHQIKTVVNTQNPEVNIINELSQGTLNIGDAEESNADKLKSKNNQQVILNSFYLENDYYKFVNDNLDAARNGNSKAQYLVGTALFECKLTLARKNFKNEQIFKDSLYEDKFYFANNKEKQDLIDSFNKCKGFIGEKLEEKYGISQAWQKKSFDSGYSMAIIDNHNKQLLLNPNDKNSNKRIKHMLNSLTFNDPETFLSMAGGSALKFNGYDNLTTFTAWSSLACDNGVPCSSDASWVKNACLWGLNCGDYDNPEKMLFNNLPPYTAAKAEELKEKLQKAIETGNWDDLDLEVRGQ